MAKQFKTGILITANADGAIKSVRLTKDELSKLNTTQKRFQKQTVKNSKSMKDYAGKLGLVSTAATALAGVIGGLSLVSTVRETVALTKETNAWANAVGVSTQELQAAEFAAQSLGLSQGVLANIYKDSAEKIADSFLNGGGEAVEVLEHLNLEVADLINLSPDKQMLAIAGGLDAIGSNAAKIQIMESLASDASLLIPLLENDAELLKQLKQEAIDSGVALSALDTAQLTELDEEFRKASAAATGLGNKITVALVPAIVGFTQNVTDIIHSITEFVSMDMSGLDTMISGFVTLGKVVAVGGALYLGMAALPVVMAALPVAMTAITTAGAAAATLLKFGLVASIVTITSPLKVASVAAHLFAGGLRASAAATWAAIKAVGILKSSVSLLYAGYAGWELGEYLREQYVEARIAGLVFVGAMVTGWERLKFGAGVAFAGIKATWNTVIQFLRDEFADFLDGMSKGVGFLDQFEWADKASKSIGAYAVSLRKAGDETETFAEAQARLKKEMTGNIDKADEIIIDLIAYELASEKAGAAVDKLNEKEKVRDKTLKILTKSQQDLLDKFDPSTKAANDYFDAVESLEQIMVDFPDQSERVYLALQNLHLEYDKGAESAAELTEKTVKLAEAAEPMAQIYEDTATSVRGAFSGAFSDALDDQNTFIDRMIDGFKTMLADMATLAIARPVIIPIVSSLGGLLGVSGAAQASVISQLGGAGDISYAGIGGAQGTQLFEQTADFGTEGAVLTAQAAGGSGFMEAAGGALGAGFIGYMTGGVAAKMFDVANPGMAANLTGVGSAISSAMDFNPIVGGAIGFAIGALFKGDWVTDLARLNLDFSTGLGVSGFTEIQQSRDGGLLGSDDSQTIIDDLDAELTQRLSLTFDQFETSLSRQLDLLDIGNLDGLNGFTSSASLNVTGLDSDQVNQVITQWVGDVTLEMAAAMLPGLDAFRRAGEDGVETIDRLTESLQLMHSLGRNLDITIASLTAGSSAAAQYGIQIQYATADIISTANQLANTRDMEERLNLEQQYADQVMTRYQLEQDMLLSLQQVVTAISADISGLRFSIAGDIASITGGNAVRDPAAINSDLATITAGSAPDLSAYLDLQSQLNIAEDQSTALLASIIGSQDAISALEVARADFESGTQSAIDDIFSEIESLSFGDFLEIGNIRNVIFDLEAQLVAGLADYDTQIASALSALDPLLQEYAPLLETVESLQTDADQALTDYNASLTDFLSLTSDQVDQLQGLREETVNYYNAMLQLDNAMSSAAANIGNTLESLRLDALSPSARLDDLLTQFTGLTSDAAGATGYDLVAISDQLNALVNPLLSEAGTLYASGQGYQDIYDQIVNSLGDVQQQLIDEAPQDYEQSSLALLGSIDDLLADMQDVLSASEQAIIDAIDISRLHTVATLEDIRELLGGEGRTLASFDVGTAYVPANMPANIHQGEVIIDPQSSDILRRYGIQVSGGGDPKTLQVLNRIERLLAESSGDLRLTVVTPDGKVLKEEIISDIKKRSKRGEITVYAAGVV